jgi:excisionase family DNA binding protein
MQDDEAVCSTREAAKLLGVSLRTVQLWVESRALRAWKTAGGHRRIPRAAIDELLAQRRAALSAEGTSSTDTSQTKREVVIVEDDADLLKLYQLNLRAWGLPISLRTARNGFEGLLRIGEYRPDVVISDLNMPGMDGFEMIRTLAHDSEFRELRLIVVTALSAADIAHHGGLPESVTVMNKPVSFKQLEALVRERISAST